MSVTLSEEEYEALASLARDGATTPERQRGVADFITSIDKANGIVRYVLWVQWQETDSPLPPTTRFPAEWPPSLRKKIERTDRPIAQSDVTALLATYATRPVTVLVTPDIGGVLGWSTLAQFFPTP